MKSFKIHFLYTVDGEGARDVKITLFQNTLERILGECIEIETKDELIEKVILTLPISFSAVVNNSSFYNIGASM